MIKIQKVKRHTMQNTNQKEKGKKPAAMNVTARTITRDIRSLNNDKRVR